MSRVRVFFDLTCPYCYISRSRHNNLYKGQPAEVVWIPWEINPGISSDGEEIDPEKAGLRQDDFLALGAGFGEFRPVRIRANSHRALLGLEFARSHGMVNEYIDRFFRAYFVEGVNISLLDEVVRLGQGIGLDGVQLRNSITSGQFEHVLKANDEEARDLNLDAVPAFVEDDKIVFKCEKTTVFEEFKNKFQEFFGIEKEPGFEQKKTEGIKL